jgi:hypothetical protein
LSCYRKRQFIGHYTEIVSERTALVGGGLEADGWQPDSFVVDSSVYVINFIFEFWGMSLTYVFVIKPSVAGSNPETDFPEM